MADGTDEDGARAAAMDEWIICEAEERAAAEARNWCLFFSFLFSFTCRGTHTPGLAHSAPLRVTDLL